MGDGSVAELRLEPRLIRDDKEAAEQQQQKNNKQAASFMKQAAWRDRRGGGAEGACERKRENSFCAASVALAAE